MDGERRHKQSCLRPVGLSDNVWAGVSLFSSVYSFLWDVFIDWGLRLPIGERHPVV